MSEGEETEQPLEDGWVSYKFQAEGVTVNHETPAGRRLEKELETGSTELCGKAGGQLATWDRSSNLFTLHRHQGDRFYLCSNADLPLFGVLVKGQSLGQGAGYYTVTHFKGPALAERLKQTQAADVKREEAATRKAERKRLGLQALREQTELLRQNVAVGDKTRVIHGDPIVNGPFVEQRLVSALVVQVKEGLVQVQAGSDLIWVTREALIPDMISVLGKYGIIIEFEGESIDIDPSKAPTYSGADSDR